MPDTTTSVPVKTEKNEKTAPAPVRSFRIPKNTDAQKVEASFANGVLTVKLPKAAGTEHNERKIPVKTA